MKHIVGFSGGIDSQATARWVLNRFPREDVILLNSQAGRNEHPITVAFVKKYSETVHPVIEIAPLVKDIWAKQETIEKHGYSGDEELTFGLLIDIKRMPPSRKKQFCTRFLKLEPQLRWIRENIGDDIEFRRYSGIRRDESDKRKDAPIESWDNTYDCPLTQPIADWTKQMCFDYVKAHGEEVNPLYALGFERVGCAPCINSGKDDILRWHQRFPEMIDKVRAWEQSTGITFFPPVVPGLPTNTIDQVVEWSKTVHGGKQIGLHVLQARPTCESMFGLCE